MTRRVPGAFIGELGEEPKRAELGFLLQNNQITKKLGRRVAAILNNVREKGNLGAHGEAVEPRDAERVLDETLDVVDWFLERYGTASPARD